jgi:tRNA-splicing ligase RtcB (3'-phosphate/5'-hydroxy nucleic acid ligase)
MKKVISGGRIPVKVWLDNVEEAALEQAKNLSNLPFAFKHIALMPDAHVGYGMPIGGILATKGVVIPNAVGVDIGCGMCAIKTDLMHTDMPVKKIKSVLSDIRKLVPLGFEHHMVNQDESAMPAGYDLDTMPIVKQQFEAAKKQIGTLGGGNHFIELQHDKAGYIWIMVHSGSRNIGYRVADHYNRLAKQLNSMWYADFSIKADLAFLPVETEEAKAYLIEMQYCIDFALSNRSLMMERVKEAVLESFPSTAFDDMINIAHNYAALEHHFGNNVLVHRKGATSAREGEIGIIPGSQGTKSYIVRGLGNPESFMSCSHGAGRIMSRSQAVKNLNLTEEIEKRDNKGILHAIRGQKDLEEASSAYKDIDEVMALQTDLVEIIHELFPVAVVKG